MSDPYVSVLIPTRNPGEKIAQVLSAVSAQRTPFEFEIVVVDSASKRADLDRIRQFPIRLHHIAAETFHHGRTRNTLAELSKGALLAYLSQDATPTDARW